MWESMLLLEVSVQNFADRKLFQLQSPFKQLTRAFFEAVIKRQIEKLPSRNLLAALHHISGKRGDAPGVAQIYDNRGQDYAK